MKNNRSDNANNLIKKIGKKIEASKVEMEEGEKQERKEGKEKRSRIKWKI